MDSTFVAKAIEYYHSNDNLRQFVRFCIVGGLCTSLDAIIFYCVNKIAPYQIALVTGYLLSLVVNYFLTIYWTFQNKPSRANLIGIVAAHLFNLFVIRMSLMTLFCNAAGLNERIAYIPTLGISIITNFLIIRLVVNKL